MRIVIDVIPHEKQSYPTVGNWTYQEDGTLFIEVSRLGSWRREALIAIHEFVEAMWCKSQGISQAVVDKFDLERAIKGDYEPGDDPKAPYYHGHQVATIVEKLLCLELGENWNDYADQVDSLFK